MRSEINEHFYFFVKVCIVVVVYIKKTLRNILFVERFRNKNVVDIFARA